jgi:hypothetical protein
MKSLFLSTLFLTTLLFFSFHGVACENNPYQNLTDEEKLLAAVDKAEFAYFGKVVRLYRLPDTPKKVPNYNGYVFKVLELVKGETLEFMDTAMVPTCGINDEYMEGYWPNEIGQEFVVAGFEKDGLSYVTAVYPLKEAMEKIYRVVDGQKPSVYSNKDQKNNSSQ